ncbi:hypothetical protein [Methylobacter sp. YRD-M1]|uniref:hypothetical protein n=1 Tax=Methylobacter sp. YRD-M1 TaxID=2911520 RepID=UPI00227B57B3|nr:hypothetical protein [Methylobacter sp. YRD-M1]WAK02673.1 hypothetical protein LZ558_02455 [Methylobacter sp. YRD-M1]
MKTYRFDLCRKLPPVAVWLWVGFTYQALASDLPTEADSSLANWGAVSDAELAELRGGFTLPNGMIIDFSLEKTIYLNGEQSFSSVFQLPNNVTFSQNDLQNLSQILAASGLRSVIQNNLDNQIINSITEINITLRNLPSNISTLVPGLPSTISLIAK